MAATTKRRVTCVRITDDASDPRYGTILGQVWKTGQLWAGECRACSHVALSDFYGDAIGHMQDHLTQAHGGDE